MPPAGARSPRPAGGLHLSRLRPALLLGVALLAACSEAAPQDEPAPPSVAQFDALLEEGVLAMALAVARRDHPDLDAAAVTAAVQALARRYRELAPADAPPEQRAGAFATLLFAEQGFVALDDLESPEVLHIDSVLARRAGHCLSLSVLALAVAEAVGEPLVAVALPNHVLVRHDGGGLRRHLELTRGGEAVSEAALRARLGDFLRDDSLYLSALDRRQVLGLLLHDRGFVALAEGRRADARADFEAALVLAPRLPEAHRNLGVLHGEAQRWDAAIEQLEQAVALYPGDLDALLNLALCRHATGDLDGALHDLGVVELLAPGHPRAAALAARWHDERAHLAAEHDTHGARPLDDPPDGLQPGLAARYYRGRDFEHLVREQVDAGLDMDWQRGAPAPGVPRDDFSVRWSGWFRAAQPGRYTLFVVANDGVRMRFGERLVVDHWSEAGTTSWTGTGDVELTAGWHPLTVELFEASGGAKLTCFVGREGDRYPLELPEHLFHQPHQLHLPAGR